jgi:hypothetical protein
VRTIASSAATVLSGASAPVVLLLEMQYDTVLRVNSSAVDISWDGHTWLSSRGLGSIDAVRDTAGEVTGLRFVMSGVSSDAISLALGESARNRPVRMYCAILDPDSHFVLDAPLVFAGLLDQTPITHEGESCTVSVTAISAGQLYSRPRTLLYTDADQQRLYPGDTSLRFVVSQSQIKDVWPAASWGRR